MLPVSLAQSSSVNSVNVMYFWFVDDIVFFHNGPYGVGNMYESVVLKQVDINFHCICRGVRQCLTLLVMMICGTATGWWHAACGIKPAGKVCCLQLPCRTGSMVCMEYGVYIVKCKLHWP